MACFVQEVVICKKVGHGLFRAKTKTLLGTPGAIQELIA